MGKAILFLCVALLLSCGEKVVEKPEKLIPKDKMVDLLYDMAILTAAKNTNADLLKRNNIETMDYLYKKYGIDSTQFSNSNTYYASIPTTYLSIYTEVDERLGKAQERVEEERAQKADSVKTAKESDKALPSKKNKPPKK